MISPRVSETLSSIRPLLNASLAADVRAAWNERAKPPGSLGRLEDLVVHYCLIHNTLDPVLRRKGMYVFCADHGVVSEGVSAYPQIITQAMLGNFAAGGAAINVLCRGFGIEPVIVDVGVAGPAPRPVYSRKLARGTANFAHTPAMTVEQANHALETGISLAREAALRFDVAGIGEMGIGNSTSAAALFSAVTGLDATQTAGAGSGVSEGQIIRKAAVIRGALARYQGQMLNAFEMLRHVGGLEIAAMAGFILGAAANRLPVVIDGFIASSAALIARSLAPDCLDAAIFSHQSNERHHARMLQFLGVDALFALDLRLGEGTGAALAISLLESAVRLFHEMATFATLEQLRWSE